MSPQARRQPSTLTVVVQYALLAAALDARGVRAAVAGGGGVAGQALVVGHAPRAAAAGPRALVQVVHVQLQGVADVRLPVLLLV